MTLVMNRPDRLNALSAEMLDELREAAGQAPGKGARCLLVTGAGRGFSSGADLASGAGIPDDLGLALERHFNPLIETLFDLPIPVVAAVNGPAAGAGCSIALAADFVVAARSAYFLQAFVNLGLIPDAGATWLLPRLVGRGRALELMMLGERIGAEQALDWGLVARVVDDEHLASEAVAIATRLAEGPTVALGLIRKLVHQSQHRDLGEALAAERIAQRDAGRTDDFKAGVMAFLEKRQPRYRGK
jgi:2-(1,2-epoxy-1,2-dihydrophenyl)acetyl-CoA isomerase